MAPGEPRALKTVSSYGGEDSEEKYKILNIEDQDDRQESLLRTLQDEERSQPAEPFGRQETGAIH